MGERIHEKMSFKSGLKSRGGIDGDARCRWGEPGGELTPQVRWCIS